MFKNFEGVLMFGVPIYTALLLTMGWRANARVTNVNHLPKLLGAIGAILFVISDSLIGVDAFYSPIKHAKIWIMITYYAAQLGITLSTLDHDIRPKTSVKSN